MTNNQWFKRLVAVMAIAMIAVACGDGSGSDTTLAEGSDTTAAPDTTAAAEPTTTAGSTETTAAAGEGFVIGYSNGGGVGNGFREEQVCTAKAEALASGQVTELNTIHRNTDAAGQLSDIRDLIAAGVDAIVFNPNDPEALNPALDEAAAAGIPTVSVDAYVTHEGTYNLYNNQIEYARLGAEWLFEQIGGTGNVYYMRGLAGHPADSDRQIGFEEALANYPDITVIPSIEGEHTGWDPATTTQLINDWIASGQYEDTNGIWTSGMDSQVVDAIQQSGKPFVPIVGADLRAFVEQLLNTSGDYEGLTGIAVYNPAAVGGAGVKLALQILNGEQPQVGENNTVLLPAPEAYDNVSEEGKAKLAEINVPEIDPLYPVSWYIDGLTDYTLEEMLACKAPGE